MTAKEKADLKEKIIATIAKTEDEIAHLEKNTQPISPENSIGRVSRMDAINNKSVAEASLRSTKRKLSKLKIALRRIDEEGFGNCDRCGRDTQAARLMLLPESTRCVRCAGR